MDFLDALNRLNVSERRRTGIGHRIPTRYMYRESVKMAASSRERPVTMPPPIRWKIKPRKTLKEQDHGIFAQNLYKWRKCSVNVWNTNLKKL